MRLARKLIVALVALITVLLLIQIPTRVLREAELFEADMERDHVTLALGLEHAMREVWAEHGQAAAISLLQGVNRRNSTVEIRWVWLDAPPGDALAPIAPPQALAPLEETEAYLHWIDRSTGDGGRLYTYDRPEGLGASRPGALELGESLADQRQYVIASVVRQLGWAALTALGIAAALAALTVSLVGRPVQRLIDWSRAIAKGDLSQRVPVDHDTELGALAVAMNQMADALEETRAHLHAEIEAREAALNQLRHADRLMTAGKLASGLAHELGTPLNVVGARGQMISTGELEGDDARESGRIIWEQTQRMTGILRQLLDFTRRRAPRRQPEELADLVGSAVDLLQPMARRKGVQVEITPAPDRLRPSVDGSQIQQVLTNLLVNAIHAMPRGGVIHVGLTAQVEGDGAGRWALVTVRDEGVGIPTDHLPKIFEPFFTTKEVGEGTGLGLSVAWGIVADHGGRLEVTSAPGEGTAFTIRLPLDGAPPEERA